MNTSTTYTGYDYHSLTVPTEQVSLCLDSLPCFGWESDPNRVIPSSQLARRGKMPTMQTLYFRRNRAIVGKTELTRLARNFESCIADLSRLEHASHTRALSASLGVGFLGTAFISGGTFAAVASPPIIWLCILLAVPGFAGWLLAPFIYHHIVCKRSAAMRLLLEKKRDEIDALCEKGSQLLH